MDLMTQHPQYSRDILPSFYRTVADDATRPLTQQGEPMRGHNAPAWVNQPAFEKRRCGVIVSVKHLKILE